MISVSSSAGARYTLLHLGPTRLLLTQSDIRGIEGVDDIDITEKPAGGVGWIRISHQAYPVYCLTEEFDLIDDIPDSRKMCVLLTHSGSQFGLLCDRVDMVEAPGTFHPLPECMRLADSPVEALALQAEGIACLITARRLAALFPPASNPSDAYQTESACA